MSAWSLIVVCGVFAAEPVGVTLSDGRVVIGTVDNASDDQILWLRTDVDGIAIKSGFDRSRVVHMIPIGELNGSLATVVPVTPPPLPPSPYETPAAATPSASRVRTVEVIGFAANWDDEPAIDGVRVLVRPLDAAGRVVPVSGQVDLTLHGQDIRRSNVLERQPSVFPELGRISQRIRAADFHAHGVTVELPLSQRNPEIDLNLFGEGLLSARLGVPGQGVYQASDAWVMLRPLSILRDQIELFTGRRFLPGEHARPAPQPTTFPVPNRHDDRRAR